MTLRDFMKTLTTEEKEDYARRCGTTVAYLFQIAGAHSQASGPLARKLADESRGALQPGDLRPDIFGAPANRAAKPRAEPEAHAHAQ